MMMKKTEKNLKQNLRRSISDPDILERTIRDADVMTLYRELAVGVFYRMAERIEGTKNDIKITQTRSYPLKDIAVPIFISFVCCVIVCNLNEKTPSCYIDF